MVGKAGGPVVRLAELLGPAEGLVVAFLFIWISTAESLCAARLLIDC